MDARPGRKLPCGPGTHDATLGVRRALGPAHAEDPQRTGHLEGTENTPGNGYLEKAMMYLLFVGSEAMPAPEVTRVLQREGPLWIDEMERRGARLLGRELHLPKTAATVHLRDGRTR